MNFNILNNYMSKIKTFDLLEPQAMHLDLITLLGNDLLNTQQSSTNNLLMGVR